jgi:hypothetical protein
LTLNTLRAWLAFRPSRANELALSPAAPSSPALLRPLGEYEAIVGGGF